jgi:hypothetical protein
VAAPGLKPVGISADSVQPPQIQIPALPVDKTKPQDRTRRDDRRSEGWSQQESVVQSQVVLQQERSAAWRRFQSGTGRRNNFGAVLIDGPKPTLTPTTAGAPQDGSSWGRIDRMHVHAATYEERNRSTLDQLGSDSSLDVDSSAPVSRPRGGGGTRRRRFTIA